MGNFESGLKSINDQYATLTGVDEKAKADDQPKAEKPAKKTAAKK